MAATEVTGTCLAVESAVSCASVNNPGQPVCARQNVLLQPCTSPDELSSQDQRWVFDNATGVIMPVGNGAGLQAALCMTLCADDNFANGACSLVRNNVGAWLLTEPTVWIALGYRHSGALQRHASSSAPVISCRVSSWHGPASCSLPVDEFQGEGTAPAAADSPVPPNRRSDPRGRALHRDSAYAPPSTMC